jgi:hypothetical protein
VKTNDARSRARIALLVTVAALCTVGCQNTAVDADGAPTVSSTATAATRTNGAAASEVNGTYQWTLTDDDALAHGTANDKTAEALDRDFPSTFTVELRDGAWSMRQTAGPDVYTGTYTVAADAITFTWPRAGAVLTFTLAVDPDGTLKLTPVLPMDPGDQFVWSTKPWAKAG